MTRATILGICFAALFAAGCFDAPKPACAFLCGTTETGQPLCPDGYTCSAVDGWCKRNDVDPTFMCDDTTPPTPDAAVDAGDTPDASTVDAAAIDAGLALGSSCTTGTQCNSGFCSDDVCCESACAGDCDACSTTAGSSANGTCDMLGTSVQCRAAAGECDVAENCTGSSADCPSDGFATSGTQCTDSSPTDCDDAQCDGSGSCSQTGGVELATYECRPAAGECDVAELCDGSTGGACGSDLFESSGTPCTDSSPTDCSDAQCNSAGACVQDFANETPGTSCGDTSNTECTDPDTCDGTGTCQANNVTNGMSCTDLGAGEDTCCDGVCVAAGGTCP